MPYTPKQIQLLLDQQTLCISNLHIFNQHTDNSLQEPFTSLSLPQQEDWIHQQHLKYAQLCLPLIKKYRSRHKPGTPFAQELQSIDDNLARAHWFSRPPVATALRQAHAFHLQQQTENERTLIVNNKPYTVLKKRPLLLPLNDYEELTENSTAWVVATPTGPQLVLSKNHTPYFAQTAQLASKITAYQQAATSAQELLSLLNS